VAEHPHDHLFRLAFSNPENALGIFRAVLPPGLMSAIDPASLELEEGSFVDEDLRRQETDLLFRARLHGGRAIKIYVLVEHQSSVDPLMPFRLLRYVVSVQDRWRRNSDEAVRCLPAVIPIVFFHGPDPWSGPRSLAEILDVPDELRLILAPYVPAFTLLIDDLATQAEASLALRQAGILGRLALVFLKAATDQTDVRVVVEQVAPLLVEATRSPAGRNGLRLVLSYNGGPRDEADSLLAGARGCAWSRRHEEPVGPDSRGDSPRSQARSQS
jgi:predicted transposase YdaD